MQKKVRNTIVSGLPLKREEPHIELEYNGNNY